jgi:hypothetical protein
LEQRRDAAGEASARRSPNGRGSDDRFAGGRRLSDERGDGEQLERGRKESGQPTEYTVVGIIEDGATLNASVREIRELGVGRDDMTVVLKREEPDEAEPFPDGTRYIVVPDDRRGLAVPLGFAVAFLVFGFFFAVLVPAIGLPTFMVFISLAAILLAGSFSRVGVLPILTDMEAPREEAGTWNDAFELGKVLVFAVTGERRLIRPIREALQANGAMYYIVDRRLEPRAVSQASLHRAGPGDREGAMVDTRKI